MTLSMGLAAHLASAETRCNLAASVCQSPSSTPWISSTWATVANSRSPFSKTKNDERSVLRVASERVGYGDGPLA